MVPNALLHYLSDNVCRFCQEAPHYILALHSPNRRWGLMRKNGQYDAENVSVVSDFILLMKAFQRVVSIRSSLNDGEKKAASSL